MHLLVEEFVHEYNLTTLALESRYKWPMVIRELSWTELHC